MNRAYFATLRAFKVLTVAQQTVAARQLVVDQVTALENSKLKSGLDVSFARVNLGEAKLLLVSAQNDSEAAMTQLSEALGYRERQNFELQEPGVPALLNPDVQALIAEALAKRPELAQSRAEESAAERFTKAERALAFPTVTALAGLGAVPGRQDTAQLPGRYGALGLNISVPVFNGHLFSARRNEAELHAASAGKNLEALEAQIARDVRVAWLNASTAQQRMGLATELLDEANQALDLAQARYDLGLSSIVELSQAQLNKTSAEIGSATARYDYEIARAVLAYQAGEIR